MQVLVMLFIIGYVLLAVIGHVALLQLLLTPWVQERRREENLHPLPDASLSTSRSGA